MEIYLKYARVAYVQMQKDILPSSDNVIDGTKELQEEAEEILKIILATYMTQGDRSGAG